MSLQVDVEPSKVRRAEKTIPPFPWILLPSSLALLLGRLILIVGRSARRGQRWVSRHLAVVVTASAMIAALYGVTVLVGSNNVPAGTSVMGVDIGGMSRAEAEEKLTQAWAVRSSGVIAADGLGQSMTLPVAAANFDIPTTVRAAATSRWAPWDLVERFTGGGVVQPDLTIPDATVSNVVTTLENQAPDAAREPSIVYEGLTPVVVDGRSGLEISEQEARNSLITGIVQGEQSVELPASFVEPIVNHYEVQKIVESQAISVVEQPVTVSTSNGSFDISPTDLAPTLTFVADGKTLVPHVDVDALLTRIAPQIPGYQPVQPAVYDKVNGDPVVTPSVSGRGFDPATFSATLDKALASGQTEMKAELVDTYPSAIPAELVERGVTHQVSTFTQEFAPAEYRRINIGQAAQKINGVIIEPGQEFSMNSLVGERTVENGFTEGIVIGEGGALVKDMGGGVSAATTAVWTAAFFAGMEKVEQHAHSVYISSYTPGLEATVSWGNLDLIWRNNSSVPVLVQAEADGDSITVNLYGQQRYDKVEAIVGEKRNYTQPGSLVSSGDSCVRSSGIRGFDVTVQRVMFAGGQEVSNEPFMTHYQASPAVSCQ